ncbi:PAS domain-containing protein (plasmid) [Rhizobium grahamii]|uniref:PAS domain-containing protein n=1 Tax=Rhizobium grahamii TaxID=1120045 RepID=A0A5Q0CFJ7_9HYPH|nr:MULTISPECIES: PAS domain-containing protein [Rhizobium]QFY62731.1 PAS domain-containing protein [Rhizobium grahamii]QRM52522.1 PAS domain-containing protein [Rhizobium sp. BG6]
MKSQHNEAEAPFEFDELFFSRTDKRGKICSGNSVFRRISRFDWDELLGKPHNVIRHPDMPRGVFWLMWDRIRRGLPTGAYIKNRAKDGDHYWVYAIVTSIEDGYLSVRLKPSGPLFEVVKSAYERLLSIEERERVSPQQSASLLMQHLQEHDFEDYDAFMASSLLAELAARDDKIGRSRNGLVELLADLCGTSRRLYGIAREIMGAYANHRFVPLNLIVHSGRLGSSGAAIGKISQNYGTLATEIEAALETFSVSARKVTEAIQHGAFLIGTARLQDEMSAAFLEEVLDDRIDRIEETTCLDSQTSSFWTRSFEGLAKIQGETSDFIRAAGDMKRLSTGLAAIRVMGKVEAGRLRTRVLSDLVADLAAFQERLNVGLVEISRLNDTLLNSTRHVLRAFDTADGRNRSSV